MTDAAEDLARNREAARSLLHEWVTSEPLRRHNYAVEAAVRHYARLRGADEDAWGTVALLHDFDYERHPTLDQHPQDGAPILRERGYPEWFVRAVLSHADHLQDVPRESDLEHHLYACDELAGFIVACGFVRPEGLSTLEVKSVKKKFKQPAFAAGVHRDDVVNGATEIGLDLDEHMQNVIDALRPVAVELGLPA